MQKYLKGIISVILTVGVSYGIIFAWSGLTATPGDV